MNNTIIGIEFLANVIDLFIKYKKPSNDKFTRNEDRSSSAVQRGGRM